MCAPSRDNYTNDEYQAGESVNLITDTSFRDTTLAALAQERASRTSRFVLGLIANLLLLVLLVNLLAPIIAAAMATHLFHQRAAGGKV